MFPHDKQELMTYCRVDDEAVGDLLVELSYSAAEYLASAGIQQNSDNEARYALAVKALTLHYLDSPTQEAVPAGLQSVINQLKHTSMIQYKEE